MIKENEVILKQVNQRETGFEILRIISMFLITCVHVLNYGGMLEFAGGGTLESQFMQKLIYSFFTTSVNIFILISGYFLVKSKFKLKKLIKLWFQVFFYSLVSYVVTIIVFNVTFDKQIFIGSLIPIINNNFWFISTYFLLYLFSPFLNNMIKNTNKKQYKILMIGILIFVYLTSRFRISNVASLNIGYSFLWFCVLYIVGAYFKIYPPQIKKNLIFLIYIFCIILTWIIFLFPPADSLGFFNFSVENYNSPLVFIASVSIFLLFRNIKIKSEKFNKVICFLSACMFGIYLFQESYIKDFLYFDVIKVQNFYNSSIQPWINVLYIAMLIFLLGLIVEIIRKFVVIIFNKIINKKINKKINK